MDEHEENACVCVGVSMCLCVCWMLLFTDQYLEESCVQDVLKTGTKTAASQTKRNRHYFECCTVYQSCPTACLRMQSGTTWPSSELLWWVSACRLIRRSSVNSNWGGKICFRSNHGPFFSPTLILTHTRIFAIYISLIFKPDDDSLLIIHLVWSEDIPSYKMKRKKSRPAAAELWQDSHENETNWDRTITLQPPASLPEVPSTLLHSR